MPAYEGKRVTVTLTATVGGDGHVEDFVGAVTRRIREKCGNGWEDPGGKLTVTSLTVTDVSAEKA